MVKGENIVEALIYYKWHLIMLPLDCNHIKVVHAKKSNKILKLIFNCNKILLKLRGICTWVHARGLATYVSIGYCHIRCIYVGNIHIIRISLYLGAWVAYYNYCSTQIIYNYFILSKIWKNIYYLCKNFNDN